MARHQVSGNNGKSPSVLRQEFENAVAVTKLVVIQERKKASGSLRKTSAGGVSLFEETAKRPLRELEDNQDLNVKSARTESEAPGEEGEEVKSPKRKVLRV